MLKENSLQICKVFCKMYLQIYFRLVKFVRISKNNLKNDESSVSYLSPFEGLSGGV